MSSRLEHANLTVRDIDAMVLFITTALPDFRLRHSGGGAGERWAHVGSDDSYIALTEARAADASSRAPYSARPGFNHLGFEVPDVAAVRNRLLRAGYRETTYPNSHPFRSRVYFNDSEGNDWEFVQYHSMQIADRNDYGLEDKPGERA